MSRVDQVFLALHVFGVMLWIGGLQSIAVLLGGHDAETDSGAKGRFAALARQAAIVADVGATLAIGFGLHRLIKYELLSQPWMHIKLTLVVGVLAMHGFLRVKTKRAVTGRATPLPGWVKPVVSLLGLAIILMVFLRVPAAS